MEHIIKNNPCSLETWIGADEVLPNETDLHFSRKDENFKSSKEKWWSATFINPTRVNHVKYRCALK